MNNSRLWKISISKAAVAFALPFSLQVLADVEIKPSISSSLIHVTEANTSGFEFEGHEVLLLSPELEVTRTGNTWQMDLSADHTEQLQLQSGIEDVSYSNYSLNNTFSWWQDRVVFQLGASRNNQNIDNTFVGVSDPIFGRAEYVDVDRYNSSLLFQNSGRSNWSNSIRLGFSQTVFDEDQIQDTSSSTTNIIAGDERSAQIQIQYGQRPNQFRGGLNLSFTSTDRENRGEQDAIAANLLFGIPIYDSLDLVATANMDRNMVDNSLLQNSDLENESYGAGLAWRFGIRSNLQLTYNKDTRGEEEEFVGYKVEVYPNERTSLRYEQSRRFYGESHSLNLNQTGNRWSLNVNYGETLSSQTRLERTEISLGDYLCPETALSRTDCELLTEIPDEVELGFVVAEFFQPEFSLDEEVTLAKSGVASFSYQFKKASLILSYSNSETQFLERNVTRDSESYSFSFNHNMTRRNVLRVAGTQSETSGDGENRDAYNVSVSFERKLTRKAVGTFAIKKVKNESNREINNREDTRLEVTYSYSF